MPTDPNLVQCQISTTDASAWTPYNGYFRCTVPVTLPAVVAGHVVQVVFGLICEDPTLEDNLAGCAIYSDSLGQTWTPYGAGWDSTLVGGVAGIWNGEAALLSASGDLTLGVEFVSAAIPSSPLLAVACALEYAMPAGVVGISEGLGTAAAGAGSALTIGPVGADGGMTVALGVAVNETSPVTAGGGFTTLKSATGLVNNSSVVLAQVLGAGSVALAAAGTGAYALGGIVVAFMPTFGPPTCSLSIASVTDSGLPGWVAGYNYDPITSDDLFNAIILDPNGNLQYCIKGGVAGSSIPTFLSTPGAITTDGATVQWKRVNIYSPLNFSGALFCKLGATAKLSWSTTGADTVTIDGGIGSVALSGTLSDVPSMARVGTYVNPDQSPHNATVTLGPSGGIVMVLDDCASYTLTATGPGGSTSVTVPFVLISIPQRLYVNCFAPVNVASPSSQGVASAMPPVPLTLDAWQPNFNYTEGQQVRDSNGNGQLALSTGPAGGQEPIWSDVGETTTEVTGLKWQNFGQRYPGMLVQRGFGPLWGGGYSTLGFGFEGTVILQQIANDALYQANHNYAVGDRAWPGAATGYGTTLGLPILRCIQAGTSGPAVPQIPFPFASIIGQIVSDDILSGGSGSSLRWQVMGPMALVLSWVGTTIAAPAPVGTGVPLLGSGPLPQVFDGTVKTAGNFNYATITAFRANPATLDQTVVAESTNDVLDDSGHFPSIGWVNTALASGYVDPGYSAGYQIAISGVCMTFSIPFVPAPVVDLSDIVTDLCLRAGLTESQIDTSLLQQVTLNFPTNVVAGYVVERMVTAAAAIKELMVAYFFGACESDGVLKFVPRTFLTMDPGSPSAVFAIQENDLGIAADKGELEELFAQEQDLPLSVTVLYNDVALNWQQGKQVRQRNARTVFARNQQLLSLPLSLSDDNAIQIAEATLYSAWEQRQSFSMNLWRALYMLLDPTDIVYLNYEGETYEIRIVSNTLGQGFVVSLKAVAEDVRNYGSVTAGVANQAFTPAQAIPATLTFLFVLDLPLLRDIDSNPSGSGFYAALGSNLPASWPGAALYSSADDANFTQIDSDFTPACFGNALNALPAPETPWTWDRVNVLGIRLVSGSLAGDSELNVLNGANALIVGGEVIQFVNAVQNSDGTWTVSRLLRGRRGTESWCASHVTGETVIEPTAGGVLREAAPLAQIGKKRYYRAATVGKDVGTATDVDLTLAGYDLYPYAVSNLGGVLDGSDFVISWLRRTRIGGALPLGWGTVPLSEESEAYEVDVLDGAAVVRTLAVTSPTATYTEADQVADFGSAQSSVTVNVYQISASIGRGFPATAALPLATPATSGL